MTLASAIARMAWAMVLSWATLAGAGEYHVAPTGDDASPGTRRRPFRTLQRGAKALSAGDTCIVHGGTYRETVALKASGRKGAPVRIEAEPGETVVLSGTEPIAGPWQRSKGRIYRTSEARAIGQVFVDGEPMTEARWPNMPFARRWDPNVWRPSGAGSRYGMMVDAALAETHVDWTGAVATLNIGSWQTFRRVVLRHGRGGDRFTYDTDPASRLARGKAHRVGFDRYFLAGTLAALDSPGEWFQDRRTRELSLWAPDGSSPASRCVEGKVRGYAIVAKGLEYVELRGLHLFATTLKLENCRHCRIENLHLRYPTAVRDPFGPPVGRERADEEPKPWASRQWFRETSLVTPTYVGGEHNVVADCSIRFANGSAITLHGRDNTIDNCLMHDIDYYGLDTGLAVDLLGAPHSTIRRCTVFRMGSSEGIRLSNAGPSVVEHNHIHHGGRCQSDGALVQAATPGVAGTVVRYNWVHDHDAFNHGGNGIRGDDRTRGLIVHHNVVWRCRYKGIIVKGDGNRVYNNTCLDNPGRDILVPIRRLPGKTREVEVQNVHSEIINNVARDLSGRYAWERKDDPPRGKLAANYRGGRIGARLVDPNALDFRPRAGSPLIDAGREIKGITDGSAGTAPDVGAYEHGRPRWVPGYRNRLWFLPDPAATGGRALRVLLAMPPSRPVTIVLAARPGGTAPRPATLSFTSDNWMKPRRVVVAGATVRVAIRDLGLDETVDLTTLDPRTGAKVTFRTIP